MLLNDMGIQDIRLDPFLIYQYLMFFRCVFERCLLVLIFSKFFSEASLSARLADDNIFKDAVGCMNNAPNDAEVSGKELGLGRSEMFKVGISTAMAGDMLVSLAYIAWMIGMNGMNSVVSFPLSGSSEGMPHFDGFLCWV